MIAFLIDTVENCPPGRPLRGRKDSFATWQEFGRKMKK
jgi:hypothetical protein